MKRSISEDSWFGYTFYMAKKVRVKIKINSEVFPSKIHDILDRRMDNCAFENETYEEDLSGREFYECTFKNIILTNKALQASFTDVIFDHCDFSNVDFEESSFRRVEFIHCRLTGAQFINATLKDVLIKESQCNYTNWNGSKMTQLELQDTIFTEGSFSLLEQKDVVVEHCDFTNCEFINTKLNGFDFSTSEISGITVTSEDLKGAIVNSDQAIVCAKLLGMIVKD